MGRYEAIINFSVEPVAQKTIEEFLSEGGEVCNIPLDDLKGDNLPEQIISQMKARRPARHQWNGDQFLYILPDDIVVGQLLQAILRGVCQRYQDWAVRNGESWEVINLGAIEYFGRFDFGEVTPRSMAVNQRTLAHGDGTGEFLANFSSELLTEQDAQKYLITGATIYDVPLTLEEGQGPIAEQLYAQLKGFQPDKQWWSGSSLMRYQAPDHPIAALFMPVLLRALRGHGAILAAGDQLFDLYKIEYLGRGW